MKIALLSIGGGAAGLLSLGYYATVKWIKHFNEERGGDPYE